jgi:predicted secreted acid phosphatase
VVGLVAVAAATAISAVGVAGASSTAKPATHATHAPINDSQIPNLTKVETSIEAYYGDTVVGSEHYASATSNYARQINSIERHITTYLTVRRHSHKKPAIVLDVDDTTLLTYNYELEHGFAYDPASNAAYVQAEKMSAVFGMPKLIGWAQQHGYTIFYLTGRPESQRAATAGNLAKVGYQAPDQAHLFLKNADTPPAYLGCGSTCTTIQYKSGTRAHIESLGYDITADIGDQYSDLSGGSADRTFKLPNPMYYLP